MQVHLQDKVALLIGEGLAQAEAIAAALGANGAVITYSPVPERLDLLVTFSQSGTLPLEHLAATCRSAADAMGAGGRILNVVSVAGLVPIRSDNTAPLQAGTTALSRCLALEFAPRGILVNALAVAPDGDVARRMASHAARKTMPSSEAIADAALFLLDPDNTYSTGHVLVADGGWSIGYGRDF